MSEAISREFARMYAHWELELPDEDVRLRRAGEVTGCGWPIRYQFGQEDGQEYIEFFASHRMTNDGLYRIYADGQSELVGASLDLLANSNEETRERVRAFYEMVRERGFGA